MLDRLTTRGDRSRFISRAVMHYVQCRGRESLRERLKAGYRANAEESLKIAAEWFPLEGRGMAKTSPSLTKGAK